MESLVGKILSNRYQNVASLGRGGMAEVFKAWDQQRAIYVALKMLRQDLAQDIVFLRRFKREAHTLKKLQHPNIVRFYGIEKDDLNVFMLMEYIEGPTLQGIIFRNDNQPLDNSLIENVTTSVCSALHYAHQLGLVHCDIKPGNIMMNDSGLVQLTDFGIARMTDTATVTMVGFGTPAYMAPELVRGDNPSPQSDIYSFGIVLYEMVTGGERPFTGTQSKVTGTMSEKVRWEQMHLPPPSPRKYNSDLSPALESVILSCLAKVPNERFSSALDVLNAFKQAIKPVKVLVERADIQPESPQTSPPLVDKVEEKPEVKRKPKKPVESSEPAKDEPLPSPMKGKKQEKVKAIPVWTYYLGGVILVLVLVLGSGFGLINRFQQPSIPTTTPQTEVRVWNEDGSNTLTDSSTSIGTASVNIISTITQTPSTTPTSTRTTTPTRTPTRRVTATATNTRQPTNTPPPPPTNTKPPPPPPPPSPTNTQPPPRQTDTPEAGLSTSQPP